MNPVMLQTFIDAVEPERGGTVLSLEPVPGGYSRETAFAEVRWADGTTERLVVRSDPDDEGSVFRSDRAREWQLLNTLFEKVPTLRVPQPRYFDAMGEYMGSPCIVSEAIPADSMQAALREGLGLEDGRRDFVEVVATVHSVSVSEVQEVLPAPVSWNAHIASLMDIYDRIIDKLSSTGQHDPVLRYVRKKMRANPPVEVPLALVHGDLQPSNILIPAGEPPAIIDWEFSEIGDPRQDLGYYFQYPVLPQLYLPDPEAFCAAYRDATGLTEEQVNPRTIEYFYMLGIARLFEQEVDGALAIAAGEHRGALGPYLIGAITHLRSVFLNTCLELPYEETVTP